ncbi:hypothetical protein AVEN_95388-1 [Araneus ventricosus]|uniref:Uncharacterized protein n=1 Tax=Araneus ventricosus TaxID=182803 RepID=A0A4Y2CGQ2_ARAVE|nr:hypothetical protein AVEN_95388-1 [Araneus ventricosus]
MCEAVTDEDKFADDLLMFVMDEYLTNQRFHRNLKQFRTSSPFTIAIRFTVRRILEEHDVEIRNIFNSLLGYGNMMGNFKDFVTKATNAFVQRGYSEKEFIEYCAFIAKLATLCYVNSFRNCISLAATAIVELVKHFKLVGEFTSESWDKLNREVQMQFYKYLPRQSKDFSHQCCGCTSGIAK